MKPLPLSEKIESLKCSRCGASRDPLSFPNLCECGGPLFFNYNLGAVREFVSKHDDPNDLSMWRFQYLYPVDGAHSVSLREGQTRVERCKTLEALLSCRRIYLKMEGENPTGSFKDRGSSVELTRIAELGKKAVCVASTGNMAASVAAFSARAGVRCNIFVPKTTPKEKLAQAIAYGSRIYTVDGTYDDAVQFAAAASTQLGAVLVGNFSHRCEGQKSVAFELVHQLIPSSIVVPTGNGTLVTAIWKGLNEFYEIGIIRSLPRLYAAQVDSYAPIAGAFAAGSERITPLESTAQTAASAIAVKQPTFGNEALRALRESKGDAVTVSDDETLAAQLLLAKQEGVLVEPSSAVAIAALPKLIAKGSLRKDDTIVCIGTGNGMKDPSYILKAIKRTASDVKGCEEALEV